MVECIFTIDYEIYGDGRGSLRDIVYRPTRELQKVFEEAGAKFVNFVEALEFDQIERQGADKFVAEVRSQIRDLREHGHEIGLHLHPQWANGSYREGAWELDYAEYNLCTLSPDRIGYIVDRALFWLRETLEDQNFIPLSFRAGNWLFQPSEAAARVLSERGVKIDSSVFKGGLQHKYSLDYRAAQRNGWYWRFGDDVNQPDPCGALLELPIYTEMVPFWRMITKKRVALQNKGRSTARAAGPLERHGAHRFRDYLRPCYPLKLDFCRMTIRELTSMIGRVLQVDAETPSLLKPIVAIGHSKDLVDVDTVKSFLMWLTDQGVSVSTFNGVFHKCCPAELKTPAAEVIKG